MEDALTELNEVVVMPYNLTGELKSDMDRIYIEPVITASTEGLPNAYVKPPTQSQRKLYTARTWDAHFYVIAMGTKLDPLINYFSGRTKMLNERVARDEQSKKMDAIRSYYPDSLYLKELKIPENRIGDFLFSCEKDSLFEVTLASRDRLLLWEVLKKKSAKYLENNKISKD